MTEGQRRTAVRRWALVGSRTVLFGHAMVLSGVGLVLTVDAASSLIQPWSCPVHSIDCGSHRGLLGIGVMAGLVILGLGMSLGIAALLIRRHPAARVAAEVFELALVIVSAYALFAYPYPSWDPRWILLVLLSGALTFIAVLVGGGPSRSALPSSTWR